jgi:hypothetical protein
MPFLRVADIQREVSQAHPIPGALDEWLLRLELEDFENGTTRHSNPTNLAAGHRRVDTEERSHPFWRCIGDTNQWTSEDIPIESYKGVEIPDGNADVTK